MKTLLILAFITGVLLWYALHGRDWLKSKPWAERFFAIIEPVEIALFKKSETILVARTLSGLGVVLTVLTQISSIDLTPIIPFVPEKYAIYVHVVFNALPLLITGLGAAVERLRNRTTKPIELVTIPDKLVAENPVLANAVASAEVAKVEAVAVVTEAKAA